MTDLLPLIQKVSVLVFLVCSMAATGLSLAPSALLAPLRNFRFVAVALGLNFVVAPALAWLVTAAIPLERGHAVGLLLLSAAAGAPFLPKLVRNARGDLSLAGALVGLLTAGTIIFLPLALPILVPGLQTSAWSIAKPLLLLILLPLIAGMLVQNSAASFARRVAPIVAGLGNAGLLVLFGLLVALNFHALLEVVGSGAILAALLYIAGLFAVSWFVSGRDAGKRGVLALATSARNFGAALVPAESFANPAITTMLVVCAIVCLVLTFAAAAWVRKRSPAV